MVRPIKIVATEYTFKAEYRPVASETLMMAIEMPVFFAKDLFKPFSTIKPESQNTGSPTINPVRLNANAAFFYRLF